MLAYRWIRKQDIDFNPIQTGGGGKRCETLHRYLKSEEPQNCLCYDQQFVPFNVHGWPLSDNGRPLLETVFNHGETMAGHGLFMVYPWSSRRGNLATFPKQISGKFKIRHVAYINIVVSMVTESW